jgi:uncharacterized RDD family membrane protein YckC
MASGVTDQAGRTDGPLRKVASTGARVWAEVADGLFWSAVQLLLLPVALVASEVAGSRDGTWGESWLGAVALVVGVGMTARWGMDPGKWLVGVRVVDVRARPPGLRRTIVRELVMLWPVALLLPAAVLPGPAGSGSSWAAWAIGVAWWVGLVWSIHSHPLRQGWHDRVAGTWVIDIADVRLRDRFRLEAADLVRRPAPVAGPPAR